MLTPPPRRFLGHRHLDPDDVPRVFAERLALARRHRTWTQPELVAAADAHGVPHYEAQLLVPGLPVTARLARR